MIVLGVDACRLGWFGVALQDGAAPTGVFGASVHELVAQVPGAVVIAIDIPIGLPERGLRQADVLVREAVGPRRPSVFLTPVRAALEAPTYAEANRRALELTGRGISRQSYRLRQKILEVDGWLGDAPVPVFEVHPEVSFATLAGWPRASSKKTWAGVWTRLDLLAGASVDLPADLGEVGGMAAVDDVVDAAVAAWSARRLAEHTAISFPGPPEAFDGRQVAIWA